MKLYFAPDTCSLSPHIVLRELGLPFQLVRVNNQSKKLADGSDFLAINPKGYVAALQLENGEVLTEGPAILQYLADLKPESGLAPPNGSWERIRLQEWLNFITSEIHAGLALQFNAGLPPEVKEMFKQKLFKRFGHLVQALERHEYLCGPCFGVADAYLYAVLLWTRFFDIDLERWPALAAFMQRMTARPAVQAALAAESAMPAPAC
ncbi:glutathione transferase GstA [Massilia sp. BJB1822]|uniref:glutathione transferase GstA n=1 Tax=Massilia sp. BJB1822 TaxID=2744470 RepID=UPI0015938C75|nr:glutathione transferase GstA [Massilia sp. BJB1822]NVE00260.1 glutathione transferase GstA [Massilia sp. BJB1822]